MHIDRYALLRTLTIALALAGLGMMAYLLYLHISGSTGSFCDLGANLSCSEVNTSIYAKVFGIPFSVLGILFFLGVLGIGLFRYSLDTAKKIGLVSLAFLIPSLYLTGVEIFIIDSICVFCEASKVLMLALVAMGFVAARPGRIDIKQVIVALVVGLLFTGASYLSHANTVPEGKYTGFAQCLFQSGLRVYGSEGCSFCAKQRALFGDAFEHVGEIECDPRYDNHKVELCVAKNIEHTPTWILEDEEGNDIMRLPSGVQSMATLAEVSGCTLPE